MRTFQLWSQCTRSLGDIVPQWRVDPAVKPKSVKEGDSLCGVCVVDVDTAAEAFAELLARYRLGARAQARAVRRDGIVAGREGVIYVAHIGIESKKGYRGEEIRFAVLVD